MKKKFFISLILLGISLCTPVFAKVKVTEEQILQEFARHNYKKVVQLYDQFASDSDDDSIPLDLQIIYSQSLANTGEIGDAIESLQKILSDLPPQADVVRLQYDLANLLFIERRYTEAKKAYQKVVVQYSQNNEIVSKSRERLSVMKGSEGRKKDAISIQLLDIETTLESGEVPDGAVERLQEIQAQNKNSPLGDRAGNLLIKIKEVRTEKAKVLLDEARRLFDEERKYTEVREILEELRDNYGDVADMKSANALLNAVNLREGKTK